MLKSFPIILIIFFLISTPKTWGKCSWAAWFTGSLPLWGCLEEARPRGQVWRSPVWNRSRASSDRSASAHKRLLWTLKGKQRWDRFSDNAPNDPSHECAFKAQASSSSKNKLAEIEGGLGEAKTISYRVNWEAPLSHCIRMNCDSCRSTWLTYGVGL